MKRFYLSLVISLVLIGLCSYSLHQITSTKDEIMGITDQITAALEAEDMETVYALSMEFQTYWEREEEILVRYIRHGDLEPLGAAVARLPYLAKFGESPDILIEISTIRSTIEHAWRSELPSRRNIL